MITLDRDIDIDLPGPRDGDGDQQLWLNVVELSYLRGMKAGMRVRQPDMKSQNVDCTNLLIDAAEDIAVLFFALPNKENSTLNGGLPAEDVYMNPDDLQAGIYIRLTDAYLNCNREVNSEWTHINAAIDLHAEHRNRLKKTGQELREMNFTRDLPGPADRLAVMEILEEQVNKGFKMGKVLSPRPPRKPVDFSPI